MFTGCELLETADLRRLRPAELERSLEACLSGLTRSRARLVCSRVDLRSRLVSFRALPLVDGPSAYFYLVYPADLEVPASLQTVRAQHRELFQLYRQAVQGALEGQEGSEGAAFLSLLSDHMHKEEEALYPELERRLNERRPTRELGYEHRGLREGCVRFEPFLEEVRAGRTTRRDRDRFEIDFFHLLEHHVEHEERGLLPALEALVPEGAAEVDRRFLSA